MPSQPFTPLDLAVLAGTLRGDPVRSQLASGSVLVRDEVTVRGDDATRTVPVSWFDPVRPPALEAGDEVVLIGVVQRRFFRAGGATASRTEVVAEQVVRARAPRAVRTVARAARARLDAAFPGS